MVVSYNAFVILTILFLSSNGISGHNDDLMSQLLKRIDSLEEKVQKIDKLEEENALLRKHVIEGRSTRFIMDGTEGPVAFHAERDVASSQVHIGDHQSIMFPTVRLNRGNAFHPGHGLFIAPQNGLYLFSTSITSHHEVHVNIMKNDTELSGAYVNAEPGAADQGSVTVVTELQGGDEISVKLRRPADTAIWGDRLSSFMGILLIPF